MFTPETIKKISSCILFLSAALASVYSQADTTKNNVYEDLSLKDLLNVKIVSVSKKTESLFDAPLSASVLTGDEIRKAGCTSIMEAMRLVPGIIVREQSNGNYDIHLRGMDNVPPNAPFDVTSNTTTLVMVNNRSVSSYLRGGTFWETLPITLNDIEKIEVIRGPAAALYGPNAVNGVINIITRQSQKDGLTLTANNLQGSYGSFINNASVGYRFNKKWSMMASGNYEHRNRSQSSYFEFNRHQWLDASTYFLNFTGDTISNVNNRYPNPSLAMKRYGGNLFINYDQSEKTRFNLSAGAQHSMVQKVSTENEVTPLSTASSDNRYIDLRASIQSLSAQVSYNGGTQITDHDHGRKYDFHITSANLEYNFTKDNFSIKPGLGYSNAVYDDRKYSNVAAKQGLLNTRGEISMRSASIRGEYKLLNDRLRLVAGLAGTKFNTPDTVYLSYEFAATYKVNNNHLFRAVYSRSPRSSNIFDAYVTKTISYTPAGINKFVRVALEGNPNTRLLSADMLEIGYRANIAHKLTIDVELFDITAKNYNTPVTNRPYTQLEGTDTITVIPIRSTNLPLELQQQGITVSLTYRSKKWQVKPFVTVQQTRAKNYAPFINMPDAGTPGAQQNNIYSRIGSSTILKSTPAVFGGASVNYIASPKFNINLNAYYYSSQTYHHLSNILFNDGVRGIDHINAKLLLNASISYQPVKRLRLFGTVKNILNQTSREFFYTDKTPAMLLAGFNYEL
jgi:iron complex outermembrane recepter protein